MRYSEDMLPKISTMVPYYHDYPSFANVSIICTKISNCYAFLGKKDISFPTNGMKAVLKVF